MAGRPRIGVLALQGDVREHRTALSHFDVDVASVRTAEELAHVDGLVLPGGESSVIDKLSRLFGIAEPLSTAIGDGLPVFGTCAGLIMLARRLTDGIAGQQTFGGLDVTVQRNAFGSQTDSFETDVDVALLGAPPVHAVFIRAPLVTDVGPAVRVLGRLGDGRVVAVEDGNVIGTSFHPEVSGELRFHARFVERVHARAA
ncbi:pyridoxal 5'-phosphate synthase glutaminase subunit PdxT [Paramicrobacterium agarici]|uniref:Pyridoxal 5'-phosphate synthase subunit PdxT n=1 Tax=Paramicrobacterium agarici TaxID=630514 RepID=A0A2A9DZD2_9MICO|nr:pyridoxal 5'-phosphate synthase glutaminase subunit PdxT [Microbacterium agarici]PFG31289.1 pyridoxal phosphate synthase yaaE subunit [Microbacterium agarici]TQO24391.1 pyridoxal phosphate synthase yaaE subunit [Microbacterium agarici]